ncbi:Rnh70p [Lachancea thermotolerans CBS 6340]|uniref:KLTH0B09416p n=1 Tax=Lachancea thermotolerans (strain ATCC 56472 / CBS 6340 / NRRL Y-8284) TaxID=559295 RepID=C5DD97_LACTC|nr:KLTH0B09416p [Lachancea thermotolerans CBS 6340]CAR21758.1 KLTH0B09416p [Lachancea thermotolerans CBS 6340]
MGFNLSKSQEANAAGESPIKDGHIQNGQAGARKIGSKTQDGKDETSFRSSVARLSICEDENTKAKILDKLQRKDSDDIIVNEKNSGDQKAGSKRRRRRSSGVAGPSLGNLKKTLEEQHSSSSLNIPKRKKKSSQPASLSISQKALQKRVSIKDLRDLVLYIFQDSNNAPGWIQVGNRASMNKMIVLFAPGLQADDFEKNKKHAWGDQTENPRATSLISLDDDELLDTIQRVPISAPGSKSTLYSAYNSFINVGLSKKEKEEKKQALNQKAITLNDLVLRPDQLLENEYPVHEETPGLSEQEKQILSKTHAECDAAWKSTKSFEHGGSHTFALDCEMCMSKDGLVLTRVSLVDFDCNLVYDSLVKPDVPIVDYLTRYSGITEEKLENVTVTLEDVQNQLLKLVSADDILIGHSLQSDLNVLKLRHPKIIDTAVIFEHKAGPPFRPALKYLASEYLSQTIQNSEGLGHDSFEDARACMELTKLKIVNGLAFGVGVNTENLFQRLARAGVRSLCLNDYAPKYTELTSSRNASEVNLRCANDEEIFDNIRSSLKEYDLFVGRLRELEFAREYAESPKGVTKEDFTAARERFVQRLKGLYHASPPSTVILVCSGTGDTRDWANIMRELNKLNKDEKFEERKKRESEIQAAVYKARDAIGLLMTKKAE